MNAKWPKGEWRHDFSPSGIVIRDSWKCSECSFTASGTSYLLRDIQKRVWDHWQENHKEPQYTYTVRAVVKCDVCLKMRTTETELKVPECHCHDITGEKLKLELHLKAEPNA